MRVDRWRPAPRPPLQRRTELACRNPAFASTETRIRAYRGAATGPPMLDTVVSVSGVQLLADCHHAGT